MANFDISNFVIDRVIRGIMYSTDTGEALWSVNQIMDPSLSITSDQVDVNDALGARIAQFDRAKNAEFTASNSLFDLGLAAAQFGSKKRIATDTEKIVTPRFETIIYKTGDTTATLKFTPIGTLGSEIPYIYELNGDQTLGTAYKLGAVASATEFTLDAGTKTLTYPTGLPNNTELFVKYEYEATAAVEVAATATEFPTPGQFIMEVFGQDVCNPSRKIYAYVIFPNAKLNPNVDIPLSPGSNHPISITAMQGYCDRTKKLFSIVIPGVE